MPLKYRPDMTPDEEARLLAECHHMELCYEESAAFDEAHTPPPGDDEDYECFDPVRDGWVGKDGRP